MQDKHSARGWKTLRPVPRGTYAFAVMAKAPRRGSIKTRLVPPLTEEEAERLGRCFLQDVTSNIARLCDEDRVHGFAAYTPRGEESAFESVLPNGFRLLLQRGGDLGERLLHASEDFLSAGYDGIALINADSPTLPTAVLQEALEVLQAPRERVILGKAEDGGYYLIGLKRVHQRLFQDITWSTEGVFVQTLERAAEIGLESHLLPSWYDVDEGGSLRRLCGELLASDGHARSGYPAPCTREYLRHLIAAGAGPRLGFDTAIPESIA